MKRIKNLREHGFQTDNKTYVIAEIGINHGGDLDTAKRLVDSAARAGADAVKFQTYLTEKRASKGNQAIFDILKRERIFKRTTGSAAPCSGWRKPMKSSGRSFFCFPPRPPM